jgi:capsular exopolysaccharide synthesis family protein
MYGAKARVLLAQPTGLRAGQRQLDLAQFVDTEIQIITSERTRAAVRDRLGAVSPLRAVPWRDLTGDPTSDDAPIIELEAESPNPRLAVATVNAFAEVYIDGWRSDAAVVLNEATQRLQESVRSIQREIDDLGARLATLPSCTAPSPSPRCGEHDVVQEDRDAKVRLRASLSESLDGLQRDGLEGSGPQVVRGARASASPVRPDLVRNGLLALASGLLFGVGVAFALDYLDNSITSRKELHRYLPDLPVLGVIPRAAKGRHTSSPRVVFQSDPDSAVAEAYRSLRTSLQHLQRDHPVLVVQVTSPGASEGKTTTCANLAVALARAGERVIVVSCDLRRPRIHEFFDLPNGVGLTSVLVGQCPLASALRDVPGEERLRLLASGPIPPNPSELLSSRRAQDLMTALTTASVDIVIVDSPPVLPVTDPVVLSAYVDATAMVAMVGHTSAKAVARSVEIFKRAHAPVAGLVITGVTTQRDDDLSAAGAWRSSKSS